MSLPKNDRLVEYSDELRNSPTPWERKLWYEFLRCYPVRFNRQKIIGHYIVDFYCRRANLVIELDGGGHYIPDNIERDKARTEYLQALKLKVLRFTNLEVQNNFYGVCTAIDNYVKSVVINPQSPT